MVHVEKISGLEDNVEELDYSKKKYLKYFFILLKINTIFTIFTALKTLNYIIQLHVVIIL